MCFFLLLIPVNYCGLSNYTCSVGRNIKKSGLKMTEGAIVFVDHDQEQNGNLVCGSVTSGQSMTSQVFRQKCQGVLSVLKTHLKESEFKVICYAAACRKGLVKPFPFHMADESDKGFETLNALNRKILQLGILRHCLENSRRFAIEEPVIDLLHWLLCGLQKNNRLEIIPGSPRTFEAIFGLVADGVGLTLPTESFKISVWSRSTEHLRWEELRGGKETGFAFLTTQVDQLHALIHLGVAPFSTTVENLGQGVELTSNLKECLESTYSQWVWGKNSIGLQMKIVALVEFILDDVKVTIRDGDKFRGTKYFIATSAAIRPRFLLLYSQSSPKVSCPNLPLIAECSAYRFQDHLVYHLPCVFAYLSVSIFLLKQTEFWNSWSLNGARSSLAALRNRLSWGILN